MDNRPNLLIIHTDQQSSWTLSAYGGKVVNTPNIDFIGNEGVIFDNFFTNSAVCTPSRGCFITGRYPYCHGAYENKIELNRDEITIGHILEKYGYDTAYIGKWHLDGPLSEGWVKPDRSMGFKDNKYMYNYGHKKSIIERESGPPLKSKKIGNENTYTTDWLTARTLEFIKRPRKNPFFLMLSIPDPHTPFSVREPYSSMYNPDEMLLPETFYQEDHPCWIPDKRFVSKKGISEKEFRWYKAQYCGEVKCIDDNVGRILECLTKENIMDNTIIVYTTDHGEYMGEHGLITKNELYETAYRIPLLIYWPKKISKGRRIKELVSTVDFQQTILGLMDIEPSGREQGRDASSLITGDDSNWENEVFIHHDSLKRAGIFTESFELGLTSVGDHILFDRENDPLQINNLFYNSDYMKIINDLSHKILEHNEKYSSSCVLDWLRPIIQKINDECYW